MPTGRLEYGCAIPVVMEQANAVAAGGKASLLSSQLPITMYSALFQLLVPDDIQVSIELS